MAKNFAESMLSGLAEKVAQKKAEQQSSATTMRTTGAGLAMHNQLEANALREEIKRLQEQGAGQVMKLDPREVHLSPFANRMENSYLTDEFKQLKAEIARTNGNVQPICVTRRGNRWILVFGHRRLRACFDLNISVNAIEAPGGEISDETLYLLMNSENKQRLDPSVYEQGRWYRRGLDQKVFPSARALADSLGVSHAWVNKALLAADLPEEIVNCFASPIEITSKAAQLISKALEEDRESVLTRAELIQEMETKLQANRVVEHLLFDFGETRAEKPRPLALSEKGKPYGKVHRDAKGQLHLVLSDRFNRNDMKKLLALAESMAKEKPELQDKPKAVKKPKGSQP